jgi:hypothetical protein
MASLRKYVIASVAAAALMLGLLVAPAAQAYPPGTSPRIATDKKTYRPKKKIKVQASRFQPRCLVSFIWVGKGAKGWSRKEKNKTIGKNGRAKAQIKKGPKKKGKYVVKVKVRVKASKKKGRICSQESASTKYKVRPRN